MSEISEMMTAACRVIARRLSLLFKENPAFNRSVVVQRISLFFNICFHIIKQAFPYFSLGFRRRLICSQIFSSLAHMEVTYNFDTSVRPMHLL